MNNHREELQKLFLGNAIQNFVWVSPQLCSRIAGIEGLHQETLVKRVLKLCGKRKQKSERSGDLAF